MKKQLRSAKSVAAQRSLRTGLSHGLRNKVLRAASLKYGQQIDCRIQLSRHPDE